MITYLSLILLQITVIALASRCLHMKLLWEKMQNSYWMVWGWWSKVDRTIFISSSYEEGKGDSRDVEYSAESQKYYTNARRSPLEFEVDDWVYLKVSPLKGVMRFGKKVKLSPRYNQTYCITKRIGNVAYALELHQELAAVYSVFHISMLKSAWRSIIDHTNWEYYDQG